MGLSTVSIVIGIVIAIVAFGIAIAVTIVLYRSLQQVTRMLTGNRSAEIETRHDYDTFRRELSDDRVTLATRFTQIEDTIQQEKTGLEQQLTALRQRLDRLESRR